MDKVTITKFVESLQAQKDKWYEEELCPHLIALLDKAQCRLRTSIQFIEGMGAMGFDIGQRHSSARWQSTLDYCFDRAFCGVVHCDYSGENPLVPRIPGSGMIAGNASLVSFL